MKLSVDPRNGRVVLSLPWRASLKPALRWAEEHWSWVEDAVARMPSAHPIVPGGTVPFEGRDMLVDWQEGLSRTIRLESDRLSFGGPCDAVASRVTNWLKRRALDALTQQTREIACHAGVTVGRIGIGDPRGRWGSCAVNGDIRYSWRLIMAPPFVLRSTVAHEVAHRVHMDHSPAFHALAAELYQDDPKKARAWLKAHGSALHWVGRET